MRLLLWILLGALVARVVALGAGSVTITVPSSAGPWSQSLNPGFDYSVHDNTDPVVINAASGIGFTPGATITVSYVSGLVRAAPDAPLVDANGQQGFPTNTYDGLHGRFPAFYMRPTPVVVYVELVGTFADNNGVIVGTPFAVGDGPTKLTVPTGAAQLQLGINSNFYENASGSFTVSVSSGCQVNATAVKMFDSHTLEIDVSGQFTSNPLSAKSLSATTALSGVLLSSIFPLPSGSTGTQSKSLFIDLASNGVPRFTDNAKFSVTASMSEGGTACMGMAQDAIVLLPVVLIPGIFNENGGDSAFPVLEPYLTNTSASLLTQAGTLGQPYQLASSSTSYPTLYALSYDTTNDSFRQGALKLSLLVNQIKTSTYADRVSLIAHSKGGLVGRQYIVESAGALSVDQFIMCETPNAGAIIAFSASQLNAALRDLDPTWPWERNNEHQPFRGTPNPELDRLNGQFLPRNLRLSMVYSTSEATPVTRTGVAALMNFLYQYIAGDGIVPAFSMLGFDIDPNNPTQPLVPIAAFSLLPSIAAFEIDGVHGGYLESPPVMAKVLSLVLQ